MRDLQRQGAPLEAIGMQAHLHASVNGPTVQTLPAFLAELRGLGLNVLVSELDVHDFALTGSMAERDGRIADIDRDLLMALIAAPAVEGIVQWGLSDRYTRLNHGASRWDQSLQRPLPFDHALQPKPAFTSICAVLSNGLDLFSPN